MESVSGRSRKNKSKGTTQQHITPTMLLDFLDGKSNRRIKRILLLILLLQYYNSICDRHYLLCQAVVDPRVSPWRKLYKHADNSSFLHMTGLNRRAFRSLLEYLFDDDNIVPC